MTSPSSAIPASLDNPDHPASKALVEEGNQKVDALLKDAEFTAQAKHLRKVFEREDKLFHCRRRGDYIYDFHRSATQPKGVWRRLPYDQQPHPDAEWELVFDLDAYCAETNGDWHWHALWDGPNPDRVMIGLSDGGSDRLMSFEFDLETKSRVVDGFQTPTCRHSLAWDTTDRLLICAATSDAHRTASHWPRTIRLWPRGTLLEDARIIHEGTDQDVVANVQAVGPVDARLRIYQVLHTIRTSTYTLERDGQIETLDLPRAADVEISASALAWCPQEDAEHPAGSLLLRRHGEREIHRLYTPTERGAVTRFFMSASHLIVIGHEDLQPWLKVLDLTSDIIDLQEQLLPDGVSSVFAYFYNAHPDLSQDATLMFQCEGMIQPSTLARIDLVERNGQSQVEAHLPPTFDATGMTTRLLQARSDDGTAIPYHLALPPDAANGPVPVVLLAYGGFGVTYEAGYQFSLGPSLLEQGIGLAIGHIRGGDEFGPKWHRAAMAHNREKCFQDAHGIACDLVNRGISKPRSVGFVGGSNGGLLASVLLTRYFETFGAINADVPVTDMLRFHLYKSGAAWIEEYGDPDKPEDAEVLRAYSPVENVKPANITRYSPILIDAPAGDDRVDPAHARRFAWQLQQNGQEVLLRTPNTGGHQGSTVAEARAEDQAIKAAFFRRYLLEEGNQSDASHLSKTAQIPNAHRETCASQKVE
ncbi:prolyl oligopeptidase family serine peptidase [Gymnodinialimonas sp. 2305UL16-5]|uniref:prolyl oligopeptidase family serine peptidase n=1 Tax=Gymnodinialimonas mytili TaxID=3126503 RepID=UPI0030A9FE8F